MSGYLLLVYGIVLTMDLVVGGSIIYWKCFIRESNDECELAKGGTLGSVAIWLMLWLVCPCLATRCEPFVVFERLRHKFVHYLLKLRPGQSRDVFVTDALHKPATNPLLFKGQGYLDGYIVRYREDGLELRAVEGQTSDYSKLYMCDETSDIINNNCPSKIHKFDDS